MFRNLFKKETSEKVTEVELNELQTTDSKEQQLPNDGDLLANPATQIPPNNINVDPPLFVNDGMLSQPIEDEDFTAELNVDDVGIVDDIDEDVMREELQNAIKEELMSEENLEAVQERADAMEREMGITRVEWDEIYDNPNYIGYEDRKQQALVFDNVLPSEYDVFEDTLLDVGCGIGDMWAYCQEVLECENPLYTGIDVNQEILELAKKKFPEAVNNFKLQEIESFNTNQKWDWVIAMSAFNVKVDVPNQTEYVKNIIRKMYDLSNKGISINLMHSFPYGEDWSDEMVTFDSIEIASWAMENFYNVKTHRNYIDRDFYLTIYK